MDGKCMRRDENEMGGCEGECVLWVFEWRLQGWKAEQGRNGLVVDAIERAFECVIRCSVGVYWKLGQLYSWFIHCI